MNDSDALSRAIQSLAVEDVYLRETSVKQEKGHNPKFDQTPKSIQFRHKPREAAQVLTLHLGGRDQVGEPIRLVRFYVDTGIRVVSQGENELSKDPSAQPEEEARICAELNATFVAEYRVTSETQPDEDALREFGKQNVMYHIWPYWREYVQSMSSRLRLPDIVLPMFRLPKSHRNSGEAGDAGAEEG